MLADKLIQPDTLIEPPRAQTLIIETGPTPSKNGGSFETKINRTTSADEHKNTEQTVYVDTDCTAAPPDDEITRGGAHFR